MIIRITARGDPDCPPITKTFQCGGGSDDPFAVSAASIGGILSRGGRINMDQALLLVAARTAGLIAAGGDQMSVRGRIRTMLRAEQVMIGVPEMMRHLKIDAGPRPSMSVAIDEPIRIRRDRYDPRT